MSTTLFPAVTVSSTAKEIGNYPLSELMETKARLIQEGRTFYDFGAGDDSLPVYQAVIRALQKDLPATSQYPLVRGTAGLRESIRKYVQRRFSVSLQDQELIPVAGSKEGLYHLPSLVIEKKSNRRYVLGPVLAYPPYIKGTLAAGGEYIPLKGGFKESYLIELADVSEEILHKTALAIINYPHNPTGVSCDLEYLKRQVKTARKYGFLLVSDECYADIYFGKTPPPSVLQVTTEGVLAVHSLSKRSGMTGYRSGFIAGDESFIEPYAKLRNAVGTAMPEPIVLASIPAWNDDEHVKQRRDTFREARTRFLQFFDQMQIEYLETEASFYLWAKAPMGHRGKSYAELLAKHGILVAPGDFFGDASSEWFRVSLILSLDRCEEAFKVWSKAHKD